MNTNKFEQTMSKANDHDRNDMKSAIYKAYKFHLIEHEMVTALMDIVEASGKIAYNRRGPYDSTNIRSRSGEAKGLHESVLMLRYPTLVKRGKDD